MSTRHTSQAFDFALFNCETSRARRCLAGNSILAASCSSWATSASTSSSVRTNISPIGDRFRRASCTIQNSPRNTGRTSGSTAMALVSRSRSSRFRVSNATASDLWTMFFIILSDSQAIEGTVFGPGRGEFFPAAASLKNSSSIADAGLALRDTITSFGNSVI